MNGKKTGGRVAGTPNKVTKSVRGVLTKAIEDYYTSDQFLADLAALKPNERVAAMEKLAAYAVPKLQTTTLDVIADSKKTIEDKLLELSDEDDSSNK